MFGDLRLVKPDPINPPAAMNDAQIGITAIRVASFVDAVFLGEDAAP